MTLPVYADLSGRPVPRGRTVRTLEYEALTLPLPDWMPAASQSGAQSLAGGALHVAGTSGTLALRTLGVDLNAHEVVAFTVGAMNVSWYSWLNIGLSLKSDAGDIGVAVFQTNTGQPTARLRLLGAGQPDQPIDYVLAGVELTKHRDLTLVIGRADRSVWLLEGDQVVHYGVYPLLRLGAVRGVLDAAISPPDGSSRELRVSRIGLTLESM